MEVEVVATKKEQENSILPSEKQKLLKKSFIRKTWFGKFTKVARLETLTKEAEAVLWERFGKDSIIS